LESGRYLIVKLSLFYPVYTSARSTSLTRCALGVAHESLNELELRLKATEVKRTREQEAISDVQVYSIIDRAKIDKLMAKGKPKRK